jgi:uncharacterized membrane protein (Fun14 family)
MGKTSVPDTLHPMSDPQSTGPSLRQSLGLDRHPFTRLKLFVLGIALLMMALGVVLTLTADRSHPPATDPAASSPAMRDSRHPDGHLLGHGFAPTRPSTPGDAPVHDPVPAAESKPRSLEVNDLSPFMVKGGFGLFIGFAIGFAMRAFLRLAIVIIGFYLLVLTMMAYAGWIEIHWNLMEGQFNNLLSSLSQQFESFRTFLTGAIPASGLTLVGLAVGLRRK